MSRKKSFFDKRIVVCGVFSALAVLILYLGSMIEVLDLSMSAIASLLIVLIVIEMGHSYAWMTYIAVSILSVVLLPQKLAAIFFAVFMGFYPIVKSYIERIRSALVGWILKLCIANVALFGAYLIIKYFVPEEMDTELMMWTLYVMALAAFVLYDIAISKLITAYFYKFRDRLKIYKLLK